MPPNSVPRPSAAAGTIRTAYVAVLIAACMFAVNDAVAQETTVPSVSSVSLWTAPASGDTYQRGDPVAVRVDFDRRVTITGTPQVHLTVGENTRAAALSSVAGTRSSAVSLFFTYHVVEEDRDTDGFSVAANAIRLNGGTIKAAADATTDADLTHSALAAGSGHKVDGSVNDAPSISSVSFEGSPTSGDTYELGETIELKIVFDRFIKWTRGEDDVSIQAALTIGGQTALATLDHGLGHGGGITELHFDYEVQADDFDADGISIPANAIRLNGGSLKAASDTTLDADLKHAAVSDDATRKVDGAEVANPTVTGVNFIGTPAKGDAYQTGEKIGLQVWFNRLVTVTGSPYVELTVGNRTRKATFHTYGVEVQGLGFQYTVQAADSDPDGVSVAANAIRLNGGTIKAIDGTIDAVLTHAAVPADPTRKAGDGTAPPTSGEPAVRSVFLGSSPAGGDTYERGETIDVRVLFTERVSVTGRPSLALDVGGRTRTASYWGTHYGRTASFRYTVAAADRDADGIAIAANAISLNGGSITSQGGATDAALDHAAVAAGSGHKVNGSRITAPAVSGVSITSRPRGGSTYGHGESIVVEVRFGEPVTVTGSPRLALAVGTATRTAGFSRAGGSTLWFSYRVQGDDRDGDGIGIGIGALTLNGGTIRDRDKNDARLGLGSHAIANAAGHRVDADLQDTVAPTVTGVTLTSSPQDGGDFVQGETVEIEVEFSETVTVTGSPRLTLTIGGTGRTAVYASSRVRIVRFRYVVDAGDSGALAVAPDALSLNGGSILDLADNPAVLRLGSVRISLGQRANGVRRDDGPPTVRSVAFASSPPDGDTYGLGDIVEAAVRFSEPVTVTGSPRLALAVGTETSRAAFHSADREYVRFRYSVQEQDQAPSGVAVAAEGLSLNGGSILDAAGNPASLSLAAASTATGHKVDGGLASRTVPTRAAVTSQPRNGEVYQRGESVDVVVQFNKEVDVSGQPQLELIIGPSSTAGSTGRLAARASTQAATRVAAFVSGSGERLHFRYVVQAGDDSGGGGITFAADALRLNGATITDAAGRPLGSGDLALTSAQVVQGDMVDGALSEPAAPRRAAVVSAPQADHIYRRGEHILVEVRFDTGVTVTGSPRLELSIDNAAGVARHASFVSAEHDTLRFRYDVQADDRDEDGIAIAATGLGLNGGSIRGSGGVAASLGLDRAEIVVPADKVDGRTTESTPPTVASVTVASPPSGRSYRTGDRVSVEVRFSEAVAVTGRPHLALRIGASARTAGLSARPLPDTVAFAYTVQSGDDASEGIGVPANAIRLNGGSIRDGVGNDAVLDSSEVLPSAGQAGGAGVRLACKQPGVSGAGRTLQAASAGSGDGLANYEFELTLELEEHRDGSAQPVELGCVALASRDRRFSYAITRGDTSRFTVGAADGELRYVGSGESAARTTAYLLTVTATPDDGGAPLHLAVRVVIVGTDHSGRVRVLQIGLAGFARTVAASAVQVIGQRFTPAARSAEAQDAMNLVVTLNRRTLDLAGSRGAGARGKLVAGVTDALGIRVQGEQVSWDAPSGAELIAGSAFSAGGRWGVWGSGDLAGFGGDADGFKHDGTVLSGYLGADYRFVPNALAGLAASYSSLDLTSTSEVDGKATLTGSLVKVYPYGLWMPERWLEIWGIAGLGTGASDLTTDDGGLPDESLSSWLGAAGQRAELWSGDGVFLAAKSDGFVTGIRHSSRGTVPEVHALAWRARVLLESGLETRPPNARLSGMVELGARLDGGDAQRGLGAEAGAGLRYTHTGIGLGLAGRGRVLIVHEDPDIREWGASASLTWRPRGPGSGPSVSVAPSWGRPASGTDALWRDPDAVLASHASTASTPDRSWLPDAVDVTVSYGLDGLELEVFGQHVAGSGGPGYRFGVGGSLEY